MARNIGSTRMSATESDEEMMGLVARQVMLLGSAIVCVAAVVICDRCSPLCALSRGSSCHRSSRYTLAALSPDTTQGPQI
jgi:hypothetical protein